MRILSVAEINVRAVYRHRVVSPPPRDPMLPQYIEEEAVDEEVAAIMGSISPVNVAPLVMFAAYGSPQPLYPELVPKVDDDDDDEDADDDNKEEREVINRAWQAREAEELAARAMARQADVQAEEQEEEAARVRLLREADEEEEESMEEEEEEENAEEEEDSGVDSDVDGADVRMDESSSSSSEDEDVPYDPVRDPEREARLHRVLGIKKRLWSVRQKILRVKRKQDLRRIQEKIRRMREHRTRHLRNLTREQRRRLPVPQVERPRRNRDFCYGCGRFYLVQRVRWWWRCETCGFWLCPDCSDDPMHCQRNEIV